MKEGDPPTFPPGRRIVALVLGAVVLVVVLVAGWFSWRGSGSPKRSTATVPPSPPSTLVDISPSPPTPIFAVAHVRLGGQSAEIDAYHRPGGGLCLFPPQGGGPICGFWPLGRGEVIRLASEGWFAEDRGAGLFVMGVVTPNVSFVRASFGSGLWGNARIIDLPPALDFPLRLFYFKRADFRALNRDLPILAIGRDGREIGRTSYFIQGG